MKVRFVYPRFARHSDSHPELRACVSANEYFGPPSLGIASIAAVTPPEWEIDFRDDRVDDPGIDDDVDLVAISCFTPSAKRAMELGDAFRARGRKVVMGGIFPTAMPDEAGAHCDAVVTGEGEVAWAEVLKDFRHGGLKPRYRGSSPADLTTLPTPRLDLYWGRETERYHPDDFPVQLTRGCPLKCDACILPTSMGKPMRHLPIEHVLGQLRQIAAKGRLASLTEDTSFLPAAGAQRQLGDVLDAIVEHDIRCVSYVGVSMPLLLATPKWLWEKLSRAGVRMFYLVGGFDPITRGAFTGKDPSANAKAHEAIKRALDHGIDPYTSFLVGNEDDDEGVFDRMLAFCDSAGVRKAEFAIFTPYPATPSWQRLVAEERILHRDWSKYNDANVVFRPAKMSPERLQEGYLHLWREFYRARATAIRDAGYAERTVQF
ncbi:MAG: cobalamin-dependent protein [Polyangiales bacterium]